MINNEQYHAYVLELEKRQRNRLVNTLNHLNSLDDYSMVENVYIIDKEDSERGITELVIEMANNRVAKINISGNSIHAILDEYHSFIVNGEATGFFYEGPRR